MKPGTKKHRAFRVAFVVLAGAAVVLLVWQCTRRPPAPSRVTWPPAAPAKP